MGTLVLGVARRIEERKEGEKTEMDKCYRKTITERNTRKTKQ